MLAPELERCVSELHELLPDLVQQRSEAFLRRLSEAQAGLDVFPSSPEDLERHLEFVKGFDSHRRVLDRELDDVEAHYDLCRVCFPVSFPVRAVELYTQQQEYRPLCVLIQTGTP